jgi:hypothetical protein
MISAYLNTQGVIAQPNYNLNRVGDDIALMVRAFDCLLRIHLELLALQLTCSLCLPCCCRYTETVKLLLVQ